MSGGGAESPSKQPQPPSPTLRRHQVHRSISEVTSPVKRHRDHQHSSHHHPHIHRRSGSRDERNTVAPQSAAPVLQLPPRGSLDVPRSSEGPTPNTLSPSVSCRTSALIQSGSEDVNTGAIPRLSPAEELRRVRETAAARTTGLKKSLVDLAEFSTSTHKRLDDTYYGALEKLSVLQNTIVALKELAILSSSMNKGFIKESQEVVSDAQIQLDAFGQFDSQQQRIQALQERIYTGREKIHGLSGRVDVVHKKIGNWERADREWQERTRRRLKSLWIFMSVIALVLLLLFIGARAYGPELEEVAREVREEALGPTEGNGSRDVKGAVSLNFSRGGMVDKADEILRALDEL